MDFKILVPIHTFLELIMGAIAVGGIYALVAFTLSLAFSTTHVLNIAHGDFLVLGAAFTTLLVVHIKVHPLIALPSIVGLFLVVGYLFNLAFVRPIVGRSPEKTLIASVLVTFGLAFAIESTLGFTWARLVNPLPTFSITIPLQVIELYGIWLSPSRLIILFFVVLMITIFSAFLRKTKLGKAARAMSEDHEGALILGVNPARISTFIFTVAILSTAVAGVFFITAGTLEPYAGLTITLRALTVIVIGGVGSLLGSLIGGITLGFVEVFTAYLVSAMWSPVAVLLVFFIVLIVRPQGLMGMRVS